MINPIAVIKLLNERHEFVKNHPELFPFLQEIFTRGMSEGTSIEISVKIPDKEEVTTEVTIQESELPFMEAVKEVLDQIH